MRRKTFVRWMERIVSAETLAELDAIVEELPELRSSDAHERTIAETIARKKEVFGRAPPDLPEPERESSSAVWAVEAPWGVVTATQGADGIEWAAERRDDPALVRDLLDGARDEFQGDWIEAGAYYPDHAEEACRRVAAEYGGEIVLRQEAFPPPPEDAIF